MRDRSGYICDRSEIGQRPPLQRVYSSATFEYRRRRFARHGRNIPAISASRRHGRSLSVLEKTASRHAITSGKEGGFCAGRLPPTLMPVMSSVDRETRQLQLLLVMGVDDPSSGRC
ncbi:hypothetical protein [Escherichia coli]